MVFDGLKPLKSIEKQSLFLTLGHSKKQWKIDAKMAPKSNEKFSKMEPGGGQGSIYSSFLSIFGEGEKTWFFDEVPGRPKNKENRSVERQRLEKRPANNNKWMDRSPGGSRHSRLGIK